MRTRKYNIGKHDFASLIREGMKFYEEKNLDVLKTMTPREEQIVRLCLSGKTITQIAETLTLTKYKVGKSLLSIIDKLYDREVRMRRFRKFGTD